MGKNQTLIRTILHFSLRIDEADAEPNLVSRVEEALGGRFQHQDYHGIALREVYLLGMTVRLVPWRSIGLKEVYQLTGYTELPDNYEGDRDIPAINLNRAMIDLLEAKGAGIWHVPTLEEIQAEASAEVSRIMEREDAGPPDDWPPEWSEKDK